MSAYGECITATSTDDAPWYIVPADDKENARLIVSEAILHTLRGLKPSYPKTTTQQHKELLQIRKTLLKQET